MNISPCKDCVDRHESCHVNCKKYIDWKSEHDKSIAYNKKVKNLDDVLVMKSYQYQRRR